ncbi:GHKL domain-containing protein [Candidatus Parcubacteria bacterium]|nr:GHKL domain-containing protein [Candidatus Parcubacteria bacterium]
MPTHKKDQINEKIFSKKQLADIEKKHRAETEKISKLLFKRDLELRKINEALDEKINQLEKSNGKLEDTKDILEIRLNAKTRQLREMIDGLDQEVRVRTRKLEDSQKALLNILDDYRIEKNISQAEKEKTIAIIKNMSDGILIFNNKNVLTAVNEMAIKFLNLGKIEESTYRKKNVSDLIKIKSFKSVLDIVGSEIKNVFREELKIGDKDEFIEVSVSPILINDKQIGKFIILHDISREKKVQALKTEFVSIAAHQLRTPLSAIKWTLTALIDGDFGDLEEKQLTYLKKANVSNERMIELVNDLLNLSRIEEGRYISKLEPTQIEDLVNAVIEEESLRCKKKEVRIIFKEDASLPKVQIDKEKIKLVIQNLIENALNYCFPKTDINVNLSHDKKKKELEFRVTNQGIGIPKEAQERMFNKFFRAANAVKTETVGSGLGLFINKNIIESHNGTIWFTSQEGKDTSFYFKLPTTKVKVV